MKQDIKIGFLQAAQKEQAISLLARNFNTISAPDVIRTYFRDAEHEDSIIFAALSGDGEKLLGVAECAVMGTDYKLSFLAVDESHRGQGIGTALLRHVEAYAREHTAKENSLITLMDLTKRENPSSRFYEDRGYDAFWPYPETSPILFKELKSPRVM